MKAILRVYKVSLSEFSSGPCIDMNNLMVVAVDLSIIVHSVDLKSKFCVDEARSYLLLLEIYTEQPDRERCVVRRKPCNKFILSRSPSM